METAGKEAWAGVGAITLIPYAGLCNRMHAIASAVRLSELHGVPLRIMWSKTQDCAALFTDLFRPVSISGVTIEEKPGFLHRAHRWKMAKLLVGSLLKLEYGQVLHDFGFHKDGDMSDAIGTGVKKLLVKTCYPVGASYCDYDRLFRPAEAVDARIRRIAAGFSPDTVGVHVRRTDNAVAKKESPDGYFFRMMDAELSARPRTNFYLATDDEAVKRGMEERYGDKIMTVRDAPLCRNSLEGMRQAAVDLYCLSRTRKIIGSCRSSFSEVAAEMGKIELTTREG